MAEMTLEQRVAHKPREGLSRRKRSNVVGRLGFELAEPPSKHERDVLTPVLVRLSERHLAKARDENKLDMVFRSALARHPEIPNSLIEKFVQDFGQIPDEAKDAHFAMSVLPRPVGAPVDVGKVAETAAGRIIPRPGCFAP